MPLGILGIFGIYAHICYVTTLLMKRTQMEKGFDEPWGVNTSLVHEYTRCVEKGRKWKTA